MQRVIRHFASPSFWACYEKLPSSIQRLADKNFEILKDNPEHPSLCMKKASNYWSVRVGIKYRALVIGVEEGLVWFWVGTHAEYDKLI